MNDNEIGELRNKKRTPKRFLILWWNVYFGRLFEIGRKREIKFFGIKISNSVMFGFVYDAKKDEEVCL